MCSFDKLGERVFYSASSSLNLFSISFDKTTFYCFSQHPACSPFVLLEKVLLELDVSDLREKGSCIRLGLLLHKLNPNHCHNPRGEFLAALEPVCRWLLLAGADILRVDVKMEELSQNQTIIVHGIAGAGSVALATGLTYPLDTIKVLTQVGSSAGKELNAAQVLMRVLSLSGNAGLFNGFGWLALGRIFGLGTRYGVYEILTAFYKDGREDNYLFASEALLAGMIAGAIETVISSPFELIKLRMQVTSASYIPSSNFALQKGAPTPLIARLLNGCYPDKRSLNQYVGLISTLTAKNTNVTNALLEYPWTMTGSGRPPSVCNVRRPSDVISLEGWSTLWRGLRSGIVRDSVFGGVFFSSWQFLHQAMLDWKAVGMNPPPRLNEEVGPLSPLVVSLSAGFSASVAAAASHGFDTARSRSQCTVLPKYVSKERRLLKWKRLGNKFERYTGIHPSDTNVLFRGIGLRMARSGLASFMIVGSYFIVADHLASSLT
ncbi:hypothetical protein VNO77_05310 [Canavalia gladiata]|uniref:Uncharacterized protein n=1 Tax=Canavalia gladiata TaxID=3824 RepID=A0AAN9MY47_CANGL